MVEIKGLEKFAPKDFPGFIASTVFLGGCPFRCPFCHNSDLVLRPDNLTTIPMDFFLGFIDSREGWLEGVCVSGGEPLIHEDLDIFLSVLKQRNLRVKIDTNGSNPRHLKALIEKGLVDTVAMDVKAPLDKYSEAAGVDVETRAIQETIRLLKEAGVDYFFRTTVVPGLVEKKDIAQIGKMLQGSPSYQIQQFSPDNTLVPEYRTRIPYTVEQLKAMKEIAEPYFREVRIEGV